jgi:hypothetical protein
MESVATDPDRTRNILTILFFRAAAQQPDFTGLAAVPNISARELEATHLACHIPAIASVEAGQLEVADQEPLHF